MDAQTIAAAEDRFAGYLERLEAGDRIEFAAWAAAQGELRAPLERIHRHWLAMSSVFDSMAGEVESHLAEGAEAESASLVRLLDRLRAGGDRRSRYEVGDEIARGAMGRIVVAWDTELRREVALKIEREGGSARQRRRFVEEAQIAAQLDHPGIVPVHELGLDGDGHPFFAMRLVRGKHLGEVLQPARDGRDGWSVTRVLNLLLRVCEAMAYAHHRGVVHRDLKPANVMLGEFGETYVMDWGLARVGDAAPLDTMRTEIAADAEDSALLTHAGDVVGTPAYMAPEQAAGGAAIVTAAADVYAIGAILYHLLSGAPPFAASVTTASGSDAVLAALRTGPPPPLPGDVPAELRAICERAMARQPADRYASMAALADDLRAFLENRVVAAHATGAFAELSKWVQRNRVVAWGSVAFVVLLIVSVLVAGHLWLAADAARGVAAAAADDLGESLERSRFRNARLALRLDNSNSAREELREQHLAGAMPRATHWAVREFAERSPMLAIAELQAVDVAFRRATGSLLVLERGGALVELDAATLRPLRRLTSEGRPGRALAYTEQGDLCAIGEAAGGIALWDLASGTVQRHIDTPCESILRVAWSGDGSVLVAAAGTGRVCLVPRLGEPMQIAELQDDVAGVCADARGDRVWIGSGAGRLVEVRVATGAQRVVDLGGSRLMTLALRADGKEIWASGTAHFVSVVDTVTLTELRSFTSRNGTVRKIVPLAGNDMLVAGWWRIDRFPGDGSPPEAVGLLGAWRVDWDPRTRFLAVMQSDGEVAVLDCSCRDVREVVGGNITLAGDGTRAFTQRGSVLHIYDVVAGKEITRRNVGVWGRLCTDREGRYVAIVRPGPGGVRVVDTRAGRHLFDADGAAEVPFDQSAVFSPDGTELAYVVGPDVVRRVAMPGGAVIADYVAADWRLIRVVYSLDGSHLAMVGRDRHDVMVVRIADGARRIVDFSGVMPERVHIACIALDAHAERLAIGSWNGRAILRDLRSGADREMFAHLGAMWSMAFAPNDPDLLLTSSGAGGLTFWDLATGEACYQPTRLPGPLSNLCLSDDGKTLACSADGRCLVVDLEYGERHVAGITASWLGEAAAAHPGGSESPRMRQLRDEVHTVEQRPWPRWR